MAHASRVALFIGRQYHRHCLGVYRLNDSVRRRRQEAVNEVRAGDRFGFRAAVAFVLGPDAGESAQRTVFIDCKPDNVLLFSLGVRLWGIFCKAIERDQAPIFQPASPVRRRGVADIGDGKISGAWRRRHAPTHHHHLAVGADVADDWSRIIWEDAWHRGEVADISVDHPE
jgi:hypothetical protein